MLNVGQLRYFSNLLSLSRIVMLWPLFLLLKLDTTQGNVLAVSVMFLMVATDFWDGRLARQRGEKSDLGRLLDPISDKICVAVGGFLLFKMRDLPLWYFALLIIRDIVILILGLFMVYRTKVMIESNWPGKVAVSGVAVVLITFTLDFEPLKWPFLWISVGMIAVSSISYLWRFIATSKNNGTQELVSEIRKEKPDSSAESLGDDRRGELRSTP